MHADAKLIERLGGPTALADRLKFKRPNGPARVSNWKRRGIPAAIKLKHADLFAKKRRAR